MPKEFLLLDAPSALEPPLEDAFDFGGESGGDYLVSNRVGAAIHAPEVDWFLSRSESDEPTKARILRILYEARAIAYDRAATDRKITFDESACQYCGKVGDGCGLCVAVCPQKAIVKDESVHRLRYAADLCALCGKCVGACPTGALELGAMGAEAFEAIARLYEGLVALVIDENALETLACSLSAGVAPLIVPAGGFLGEAALLTLLQSSGSQIVAAAEIEGETLGLINAIYLAIYGKKAVLSVEEIADAQPIAHSRRNLSQSGANARARFAASLRAAVGDGDFGAIPSDRFGAIAIDESRCSLCAACAQNCVTKALSADETECVLRANDSLCTRCGECAAICPEKAIMLSSGGAVLNPRWFETRIVAKDEVFRCVECGKPFAPSRSIAKTLAFMTPLFGSNAAKLRALSCCAECKPKVMLKAMLERNQAIKGKGAI
jgi:ferredoxin